MKPSSTLIGMLAISAMVALLSGCPPVSTFAVTPAASELKVGNTLQLDAATDAASLHWASSNTKVATVDAQGLVTAVATGDATISVSSDDATGSASVKVVSWTQRLTISWGDWAPAGFLQTLSEGFTDETGIEVDVITTPWDAFVQDYTAAMRAGNADWDILLGDSQDLGTMVTEGHYLDLTEWAAAHTLSADFGASAMKNYAEYPKGSGSYFAVPCEGDALGWVYRKDLFEDQANIEAFQARFGYPLRVPQSLDEVMDVAEFFNDPENGFYGVAISGKNSYDALTMFGEQCIWSFGGELGDDETYQVEGLLNSAGSVDGIAFYHDLFQFTPPDFATAYWPEVIAAFTEGKVAMACSYFAFFADLANTDTNPFAAATGYFANPPQEGADGVTRQFASLGGQGASIVTHSTKQNLAYQWLEWFIRPETQLEWARLGGAPCHLATLASQDFLDAAPYNEAFRESMAVARDFWACPEYMSLLTAFNEEIGAYVVTGSVPTAQEALDTCATNWTQIFTVAGYYN